LIDHAHTTEHMLNVLIYNMVIVLRLSQYLLH